MRCLLQQSAAPRMAASCRHVCPTWHGAAPNMPTLQPFARKLTCPSPARPPRLALPGRHLHPEPCAGGRLQQAAGAGGAPPHHRGGRREGGVGGGRGGVGSIMPPLLHRGWGWFARVATGQVIGE